MLFDLVSNLSVFPAKRDYRCLSSDASKYAVLDVEYFLRLE